VDQRSVNSLEGLTIPSKDITAEFFATCGVEVESLESDESERRPDPLPVPPAGGDPVGGDPVGGDPAGGDPAGGDPAGGDPVGGDPVGGDPVGGDPVGGDPAGGDPAGGADPSSFAAAEQDSQQSELDEIILQLPESSFCEPIPVSLHSAYEEGPFTKCTVCRKPLDQLGLYEIQKVHRGSEVVFETAICNLCGEELIRELSQESLDAMKGFLLCSEFKPTQECDHCHFCGFPRALFSNFTVVGACQESSLLLPQILMCEKCSESLNERLSRKTREVQGDFIQDNFPGVPADLDLSPSLGGLF